MKKATKQKTLGKKLPKVSPAPKAKAKAKPAKFSPETNTKTAPLSMICVQEIQADKKLTLLQRAIAIHHLLERVNYRAPRHSNTTEVKKVLLSAALAEARFWYPNGMTEQECQRRTFLHKFILAPDNEKIAAPHWKMAREEWTNFFRSAEQARQTLLAQFKTKTPMMVHAKYRSGFLPIEDLAIIYRWTSPEADGVSLAHCTAELACEIIHTFSEVGHEPKNFSRKKRQLGLVSYSKAEARGHLY